MAAIALGVLVLSSRTAVAVETGSAGCAPIISHIELIARKNALEWIPEQYVCRPIELPALHARALHVLNESQHPPIEMVFVETSGRWFMTLYQKNLAESWLAALLPLLGRHDAPARPPTAGGAHRLAYDLTRILVDPDPRSGLLIGSRSDIPIDDEASDAYREAGVIGRSEREIRATLLARLTVPIIPAQVAAGRRSVDLDFYTWHRYGGVVTRWRVRFGQRPRCTETIIATYVGSWRYFR